jgi:hypothetical protein
MAEGHRSQPVDADADLRRPRLAPRQLGQVAAARRAAADEHRVPALGQQRLHRVDALSAAQLDTELGDVADLLVDDLLGQPETRHLAAHEAAGLDLAVEHRDGVALGGQIARHGERGRPGADAGHPLALALLGRRGHQRAHALALEVGGDALQAADRHRLGLGEVFLFDPAAPAGRLAGPVAGAPEDAGEDVAHPVHQIGLVEAALADQADVLRHRGVGRTGPLAIHHAVEVIRIVDVCGLHAQGSGNSVRSV